MTATATPPTTSAPTGSPAPPAAATSAAPTSGAPRRSLGPTKGEWLDVAFLGGLTALAVFGFGTAYGGSRYFIAGVIGAALGLVVAHICARTRQPLLVVTAAIVVVFFLFGGAVAVPDEAIAGVLPSPGVVTALIDGVVQGWAKLLTTLPPVGVRANLLTVPYVSGLLAGVLSLTVARRSRRPLLAVLAPVVVLGLSILFGTAEPASLTLQGAGFAGLALAWVSIRRRNDRRVGIQGRSSRRWIGAAVMLVLAGLAAVQFGESIPGANVHNRLVLRDRTEPPFDPRDYPSPLNGYRKYTDPELLQLETLFTVSGLEAGELIRLATLDSYDGVVYTVGSGAGSSGYFQRVGEQIPTEADGVERTVTVEVGEYTDVWLPSVGSIRSIDFLGDREAELTDSFRYNTETGTAAAQALLRAGDRYRMEVIVPDVSADDIGDGIAASVQQPALYTVSQVQEMASQYAEDVASAHARMDNIIAAIHRDGARSDGIIDLGQPESRPGHSAQRLGFMVDPDGVMVGNGEQYAPLAALMGQAVGVPTRVVMGFKVPEGGSADGVPVTGNDVTAWVEIAIEGAGWVPFDEVVPENTEPQEVQQPKPKPQPVTPPPPPPPIPPSEEDETDPNKVQNERSNRDDDEGFTIPTFVYYVGGALALPLLVLGSFTGLVAVLKSRRRLRRRTQGPATDRIAGGWHEVTDLAFDLGTPVPPLMTRREAAAMIGNPAARDLARHADGDIFGPGEPDDARVDAYWGEVDATRSAMVADRTRFERWKALVSLASLRSSGRRRVRGVDRRRSTPSIRPGGRRRAAARPEIAALR